MIIKMNDRVQIGSRIGANPAMGVVVGIIPANEYREAMYRIRFDVPSNRAVTITPNPDESWVDEGLVLINFSERS